MNKTKKLFSLALVLIMLFALAVPAMAADTHTITITGKAAGHTYEAYQIFSGRVETVNSKLVLSDIKWGNGVDGATLLTELKTVDAYKDCTTAEDVAKVVKGFGDNSAELDKFAEIAGKHLDAVAGTSTASDTDEKEYTIEGLTDGYYLVKDKDNTVSNYDSYTKFIIEVVDDATAEVKGDVPSVTKQVATASTGTYAEAVDVNIGDTVYFKLVGTLPENYADYQTRYQYEFVDTMSAGLTFGQIESVTLNGRTVIDTAKYTVSQSGQNLTVKFDNLVGIAKSKDDTIEVIYSATLNENANIGATGNDNVVYLNFSNNPSVEDTWDSEYKPGETTPGEDPNDPSDDKPNGDYGETPKDDAKVYTFELDIEKVDGDDNAKKLAGAVFTVRKSDTEYLKIVDNKITWVAKNDAQEFTTDANGKIAIKGLDAGTYYIEEVSAPTGYNKLTSAIVIEIEAEYKANGAAEDSFTYTVSNANEGNENKNGTIGANAAIVLTVVNNAGTVLPSTGGIGTTLFYIIGGVLVLAAIVILITRKRMSYEK